MATPPPFSRGHSNRWVNICSRLIVHGAGQNTFMNRQEFNAFVAAGLDLKLRRAKGQGAIHIIQYGFALCNVALKIDNNQHVQGPQGPTCILCVQILCRSERETAVKVHPLSEVFDLYGTACIYCEVDLLHPEIVATKDHLIPKSKGGSDLLLNLVPSCRTCNNAKGDLELSEFIIDDFQRYQEIKHKVKLGGLKFKARLMAGKYQRRAENMKICPDAPGTILSEHYLEPMDLSFVEFASICGISASTVSKIVSGKMKITLPISVKIGRALGLPPTYWHQAQTNYDLWHILKSEADAEAARFELAS